MKITDEEIQKDLKTCDRATDGPWKVVGDPWDGESYAQTWVETKQDRWTGFENCTAPEMCQQMNDANFIASARTRWPLYIEELKELREENEELKKETKWRMINEGRLHDEVSDLVEALNQAKKKTIRKRK